MRKILIVLVFIYAGAAYAEITPFEAFLDLETMQADFVQENYYPGIDSYKYKGKLSMTRPEKALWDYEEPDELYLISSEDILHYNADLNQAIRMRVDATSSDDLSGLLLGVFLDRQAIYKGFTVTDEGETVTLTPKNNVGVENIVMTFSSSGIESVYTKDYSENTVLITFSSIKANQAIDKKIYDIKLPKGTEYFEQ